MCGDFCSEDIVEIYGDEKLYTSPTFRTKGLNTYESCLLKTTDSQYTIHLKDKWNDGWDTTSWVSISGVYGNIAYKGRMMNKNEEVHKLSLYYAITKEQSWKFAQGSVAANWNQKDFVDSEWSLLAFDADIPSPSATQFYRFSFVGLSSATAYEVRFNYIHGIIAFLNGKEIYRDNLPSGAINASIPATGSYQTLQYRGVIRNALEVESQSVLCVAIHLPLQVSEAKRSLDAWMAEYVSSLDDQCFAVPYDVETSPPASDPSGSSTYLLYHFAGSVIPSVNGVRIFARDHLLAPREYRLSGSLANAAFTEVLHATNRVYRDSSFLAYTASIVAPDNWRYYKFEVPKRASQSSSEYSLQLCVCSAEPATTIEFPSSSYSFIVGFEPVRIQPVLAEIVDCEVAPALPAGLSLDSATCTITGLAQAALANTTFTVSSSMQTGLSGSFSLSLEVCSASVLLLQRVYGLSASLEGFTVRDADEHVLLSVPPNHPYADNEEVLSYLCVDSAQLSLATEGSLAWAASSYLYLHAMLDATRRETLLRARLDALLGLPQPYTVGLDFPIRAGQPWFYKMGEVPAGWDGAETEGWAQAAATQFPASSNRLQLYKRTFSVASLASASSFTLNVKYRYGIVVSLNGQEAFRYGVEGALSAQSVAVANYQEDEFHMVSLPTSGLLVEGSNRIAIALVSIAASQTAAIFDCSLRLIRKEERSRVWDYTAQGEGIYQAADNAFNQYNGNYVQSGQSLASLTLTFAKNRRETINQVLVVNALISTSYNPKSFVLQARNPEDLSWTTLATVDGMTWSLTGQQKAIWVVNSKPFNQYRFYNVLPEQSVWRLTMLDLLLAGVDAEIPPLSYEPVTAYRQVEMAEVYPNSEFYTNFQVSPALPPGVSMDPFTGMISGTASEIYSGTHQVTAVSVRGADASCSLEFTVGFCTGGRALITLTVRTDYNPSDGSYALFAGRDESGAVVSQKSGFGLSSSLLYFDFCLEDALYTLRIGGRSGLGWSIPAGVMLSVDEGAFRFETEMLGASAASSTKLLHFSSFLPFQQEFSEWRLSREPRADAWTAADFDDAAWEAVKAGEIGSEGGVTVYLRRSFALPSLDDYQLLNVLVKFGGGLAAYFNGHRVARFNLPDALRSSTEAPTAHDASQPVFFHIVLPTVEPSEARNVLAVELHRAKDDSSAQPIAFYATAVFGVSDCALVRDSFEAVEASTLASGALSDLLDVSQLTSARFAHSQPPFLAWRPANLEGARFNAYGFLPNNDAAGWAFSLYGRLLRDDADLAPLQTASNVSVLSRTRAVFEVPAGLGGYQAFRWETDALPNAAVNLAEVLFLFCRARGEVCAAAEGFPSVASGQLSPAPCAAGFAGYAYRLCENGVFSEVRLDRCRYKRPANVAYSARSLEFVRDVYAETAPPSVDNLVTEWRLAEGQSLPAGLTLNAENGVIFGTPAAVSAPQTVAILATNPEGSASAEVSVQVRLGRCPADGPWPVTSVGETSVYECASQGSYVGSQRRACRLGATDGEWESASGMCVSVPAMVLLALLGVAVLAVALVLLLRVTRRRKAKGGLRRGKRVMKEKQGQPMKQKKQQRVMKV